MQARARGFNPYHRECKGNKFEWDGYEVIMKDNPVVILVLEPREVDNFLNNGVSIWISWTPPKVKFLLTDMALSSLQIAVQ